MPLIRALIVGLLLSCIVEPNAADAHGGPPLLSDDTGTPGDGVWEFTFLMTVDQRFDQTSIEYPAFELGLGLGERMGLAIGVPLLVVLPRDGAAQATFGAPYINLKWRFLDLKQGFKASITPEIAVAGNQLSSFGPRSPSFQFQLPLQLQQHIGIVDLILDSGVRFRSSGPIEAYWGFAIGVEARPGLSVLAEVNMLLPTDTLRLEPVFNLGLSWQVNDQLMLFVSAGRGFRNRRSGDPLLLMVFGITIAIKDTSP